jgi:hypothetical protein
MYNNNILPQTGAISTGIFGLSTGNTVAIGVCVVLTGVVLFKLCRFKLKDNK